MVCYSKPITLNGNCSVALTKELIVVKFVNVLETDSYDCQTRQIRSCNILNLLSGYMCMCMCTCVCVCGCVCVGGGVWVWVWVCVGGWVCVCVGGCLGTSITLKMV